MNRSEENNFPISIVLLFLYTIFFISIFFSLRAVSSISIGALLVAGIVKQKARILPAVNSNSARWLLIGSLLYILLQIISLLYADNAKGVWNDIERKTGLVIIPLAIILTGPFSSWLWKKLVYAYCIPLLAAAMWCILMAAIKYFDHRDNSVFFYHSLTSAIHQHAVYFSIFVFIGLVFLLENLQRRIYIGNSRGSIAVILFFSGLLFALSSRLVISFYILYLVYYLVTLTKRNIFPRKVVVGLLALVLVVVTIIFLTHNPVRTRFLDLVDGNLSLVRQDKYTPGDYFNGVQFRLIQWKLVPDILNKHHSWWKGVGAANAQPYLNQEYAEKNMYLGDPAAGDIGYRAYNNHSQPLESLLTYGIPGLLICLFIFFAVIKILLLQRKRETTFIISLLLVYGLIESVFETQYGIILFVFFPCFLCQYEGTADNQQPAKSDLS